MSSSTQPSSRIACQAYDVSVAISEAVVVATRIGTLPTNDTVVDSRVT